MQFAAHIRLKNKLNDQSGALHSPIFFLLLHTIKAIVYNEWKTSFSGDFFQPSLTELHMTGKTLIRFPYQNPGLCFCSFLPVILRIEYVTRVHTGLKST